MKRSSPKIYEDEVGVQALKLYRLDKAKDVED